MISLGPSSLYPDPTYSTLFTIINVSDDPGYGMYIWIFKIQGYLLYALAGYISITPIKHVCLKWYTSIAQSIFVFIIQNSC